MSYPKPGNKVKVIVHQKKGDKIYWGTFTGKVARMRGGAVLGFIELDGSKAVVGVPWTSDKTKVEFEIK